jgi:hypothetical protein
LLVDGSPATELRGAATNRRHTSRLKNNPFFIPSKILVVASYLLVIRLSLWFFKKN